MNIQDFKKKYGVKTPGLLVEEFIRKAPDFPGGLELARSLGTMIADLESALSEIKDEPMQDPDWKTFPTQANKFCEKCQMFWRHCNCPR